MALYPDVNGLKGHILIAMPTIKDARFKRSVIYLCAHSEKGAMGIIINQTAWNVNFAECMNKLGIIPDESQTIMPENVRYSSVHMGGPVETDRGFVLHSSDYQTKDATVLIDDNIHLTATLDILKTITMGNGPKRFLLALGYTGWASGQLESEIYANHWLYCPGDLQLLFMSDTAARYDLAMAHIGINPLHLVGDIGHS